MMAQQELQQLLNLPDQEKILLAHHLLESVVAKTNGQPSQSQAQMAADQAGAANDEVSPSARWLLSMAGMYDGPATNTAEYADEICLAEIQPRSGFTTKSPLQD